MRIQLAILIALFAFIISIIHAQPTQLTIFATASLTDVLTEAGALFDSQHNTQTRFSFGASSTLATQITEGAQADLFLSANIAQAQHIIEAGLADGDMLIFAKNRLVVIIPTDNPANIQSLADLAREGVYIALAMPDVPIRAYTDQMLEAMRADSAYGDDFYTHFYANVVIEGANVRQVVTQVALGEADAGVVYASDVTPALTIVDIPDELNVIAEYPLVLLRESANSEMVREFIAFLLSDEGQDLFVKWGFLSIRPAKSWGWAVMCEANPTWAGCG